VQVCKIPSFHRFLILTTTLSPKPQGFPRQASWPILQEGSVTSHSQQEATEFT